MSEVFTYICTKSTVDPFLPPRTASVESLSRDVSDAFFALQGGRFEVGKLAQFPLQRSVANHLLCDGREVSKVSFPELYDYLSDSQGAATDPDYFVLPNYLGTITPAATAETETVVEGTVTSPPPVPPVPGDPTPVAPLYGDVDSGGRFRRQVDTVIP
ncbi:hypothetical protein SH584_11500 [Sphingomonas sp. LY29]|uniref:hypothetical protein n=1 Tax=Sphingomonas sp. LY29 TaxID=3095341 RepID=UPI002D787AB7|nr:hypothetical protein [Sphingomonas sp. LY29]WRP25657.1 hypothetical protein SH584_11500 [Sphingomonas sp. LY29]